MNYTLRFLMVGSLVSLSAAAWGMDTDTEAPRSNRSQVYIVNAESDGQSGWCDKVKYYGKKTLCYPGYAVMNTSIQDFLKMKLRDFPGLEQLCGRTEGSQHWRYFPVTLVAVAAITYLNSKNST